jgi:predicted GIY-YIG superfamily endonuclease
MFERNERSEWERICAQAKPSEPRYSDHPLSLTLQRDKPKAKSRWRVRETDVSLSSAGQSGQNRKIMFYVYILQSINNPEHFYVGYTNDLKKRIKDHNSGFSIHTNKFKPWKIRSYFAFDTKEKAEKFEAYLKTGNGRIFSKKHV